MQDANSCSACLCLSMWVLLQPPPYVKKPFIHCARALCSLFVLPCVDYCGTYALGPPTRM